MKFVKSFLTVLAASSSLALTIPTKRQEDINMKCQMALSKYNLENQDCKNKISSIQTEEELKSYCEKMNTDKCQKFYTTSFTSIPECKDADPSIQSSLALMDVMLKQGLSQIQTGCATDEQGNFCPLSNAEKAKRVNSNMTEEQQRESFDAALKETCKSKKCTDVYLSAFDNLDKFTNDLIETVSKIENYPKDELEKMKKELNDDMKKLKEDPDVSKSLEYLKSNECAAEAKSNPAANSAAEGKTDGDDNKSGAISSMTFSSTLFVTLALLLFTL